jgi:hypothetical protein
MRIFTILDAAALLTAIGGLLYWLIYVYPHGELADKPGWAVLQGMDDPHSNASSPTVLIRKAEFAVVGFRGIGEMMGGPISGRQPQWSWVLLNEHDVDGEVKQMPKFPSYGLPCSEVARVAHTVTDADAYTIKHLRSMCRQS